MEEMLELSGMGSKVLHPRAVECAGKHRVPMRVVSTFMAGDGTLVGYEESDMEGPQLAGIACNRDEAMITVSGIPDQPGIGAALLGPLAEANIEVDMVVQNQGQDGRIDLSFTVQREDHDRALRRLRQTADDELSARSVSTNDRIAKISVVGAGVRRSHAGVVSKLCQVLAGEGIDIRMLSTAEIKVSVAVDEKYLELAVRALHDAFQLDREEPGSEVRRIDADKKSAV
jgi:aspartate kinase